MAEDGTENKTLAPPAVVALKQEAASTPNRLQMERSISEDIRVEREDLKEAAEQTLNVVLDLNLDGRVRWVSPSWTEVIGTPIESIRGKPISEIVPENPTVFTDAVEAMKQDDSKSRIIRFSVRMGPLSVLRKKPEKLPVVEEGGESIDEEGAASDDADDDEILNLEGQGIMVYDRTSGGESHVRIISLPYYGPLLTIV
jgi:serine/threonine-protein kinase RIM15